MIILDVGRGSFQFCPYRRAHAVGTPPSHSQGEAGSTDSRSLLIWPSPLLHHPLHSFSKSPPVVLGHPWLVQHNPHVDWNSVSSWSQSCFASCLGAASSPVSLSSVFQVEADDLSGVPAEYHNLCRVFSTSQVTSLPPHRPYDCAMYLLPGTSSPKGHLYSLSGPKREAVDKYINESLNAGPHLSLFLTCWCWVLLC